MKKKLVTQGFTLIELVAALAVLSLLSMVLTSAFARTRPATRSVLCLNHLKQLTSAWAQNAVDNNGRVLAPTTGLFDNGIPRPSWMAGGLDFHGSNPSNWDTNQDLVKSPLWEYVGKAPSVFKCPADPAVVNVTGTLVPRLRSMSLSQVFGQGEWLDRAFSTSQRVWRTYKNLGSIVLPRNTFLFVDEHPDSINDGAFASACTGNQPGDAPSASLIIDYPANYHNGGCGISFTDGHSEIHKWVGSKVARAPITLTGALSLNIPAQDSWVDMHWLGANTTVRN